MIDDEPGLRSFLVEAKRNTYAASGGQPIAPCRPGAKDLPYDRGSYRYLDSYFGDLAFPGQEIVWLDGVPLWAMNYYGSTEDPVPGFAEFLFRCLSLVDEHAPLRGPSTHAEGDFTYRQEWAGTLDRFQGEESIEHRGRVIYRLWFHGGAIREVAAS